VAVVVPTRDRPSALKRCLAALEPERSRLPGIEIVVVDDGSTRARDVAGIVASVPGATLVRLEGRGCAAARNAGARAVTAPLVCFTDDDCVPRAGWALALVARLRAGADMVAGQTLVGTHGHRMASAWQLIANAFLDWEEDPERRARFGTGSNLACRTDVVREVPFDDARFTVGGDDRDWCARVAGAGFRLAYEESAVVDHFPVLNLRTFLGKNVRYGRAALRFRRLHTPGQVEPARFYLWLVRRGFREGPAIGTLVALAQAATAVGFVGEHLRGRRG
jgi:GT2 family glycosyltransferase